MKRYTKKEVKECYKEYPHNYVEDLLNNWPRYPTMTQMMRQISEAFNVIEAQLLLFNLNREEWDTWNVSPRSCEDIGRDYITNKGVLPETG